MEDDNLKIPRWNWGAFLLNWVWGIGNNTYIALLMFVPIVNIIIPFILGAKGYKWAWENKKWESKEQFLNNQKEWLKWGLIVFISLLIVFIIIFTTVFGVVGKSEPISTAIEIIQNKEECIEFFGENIKKGFAWSGSINTSGDSGNANVSFTVKGDNAAGKCYLIAHKEFGNWIIDKLMVISKESNKEIMLITNE